MLKIRAPESLQARYTLFAVMLTIIVILATITSYLNLIDTKNTASTNLEARSWLREKIADIRANIFDGYKSMDAFLLDPSRSLYKDWTFASINNAIQNTEELLTSEWISRQGQRESVIALENALSTLSREIGELVKTRMDTTSQYPALEAGTPYLRPNRIAFIDEVTVAINEAQSSEENIHSDEIYKKLIQIRHIWTQMVSNFRLYLANRMGSFQEVSLPTQENAIETMYSNLFARLEQLSLDDDQGKLGFETSIAVQDMKKSLDGWFHGFLAVKRIHHTDFWRADIKIIKDKIEPLLDEISYLLGLLDEEIRRSSNQDIVLFTSIVNNQTTLLWFVFSLGITFIIIVLVSMRRLIFNPITAVTRALKAEAFGKPNDVLPIKARSAETRDLVDAFNEMRKQIHIRQNDLEYQAMHDALTGLPNRLLLFDRMEQAIHTARRENGYVTVLLLDLDQFKEINDTLGHHIGDQLLIKVGTRLWSSVREVDTVARLGGDEYAVLLPETNKDQSIVLIEKLRDMLEATFNIEGLNTYVGASIGAAVYPSDGNDAATLLQHADIAMYVSKRNKHDYAFYTDSENEFSIDRLALTSDLKEALNLGILELYYQPKIDLNSGDIISAEALLRWQHSSMGYISPAEFIPLAEQTGIINRLTYWVLEQALYNCNQWREFNIQLPVSINLSVYNLRDADFIQTIDKIIKRQASTPESIIFEITESAMMQNQSHAIELLNELDNMGIQLSIDDYGTGFSSLSYIKKLPVDELKIDKSFVMDMTDDESDAVIVKSTVDLAHNLGLRVVAEGVESEQAMNMLSTYGCDLIQGYYICKPKPIDEFVEWVMNRTDKQ